MLSFLQRIPYPRPFYLVALLFGLHVFGVLMWLVPMSAVPLVTPKLSNISGPALDTAGATIVLDDTGKVVQDSIQTQRGLSSGVWTFLFLSCMGLLLFNWFFPDFQLKPLHCRFEILLMLVFLMLWWHFDRVHHWWFPWALLQGGGLIFVAYRVAHPHSSMRSAYF